MLKLWIKRHPMQFRLLGWLILPVAVGLFCIWSLAESSLPSSGESESYQTPMGYVVISRDRWGVPQIKASNDWSAFYGMGVAHVQDRLWQMEYQKRLGSGRLAEFLGVKALASDKLMLTLGLKSNAINALEHISPAAKKSLEAYSEGVNFAIKAMRVLPPEFYLFGLEPEPWQPADSILLMKLMAFNLGANYQEEIQNQELFEHLGAEKAAQLLDIELLDNDIHQLSKEISKYKDLISLQKSLKEFHLDYGYSGEGIGSNAWAVAGKYTNSKRPILSGDPHLPLQMPSAFYLAQLNGADLNVSGATLPGCPIVIFGFNGQIAWTATNLAADVQDLYLERKHVNDDKLYEYQGKWEPVSVRHETINVAQAFPKFLHDAYEPIKWEARSTHNGPLLSDVFGDATQAVSLRWSALDSIDKSYQSFFEMNYAQNIEQFAAALKEYHAPALNFVYADVENNIAAFAAGKIPRRSNGQGILPVPGWLEDYQWQDYIPFEELPRQVNPASGMIVSANNRIHDQYYPYVISNNWQPDYRANRILELLEQKSAERALSSLDMALIQSDIVDLQAKELVRFFTSLPITTKSQKALVSELRGWDFKMSAESTAATLYQLWSKNFYLRIVEDELRGDLRSLRRVNVLNSVKQSFKPKFLLNVIQRQEYASWCVNVLTTPLESCIDEALLALQDTEQELHQIWGARRGWGETNFAEYPHSTLSNFPFFSRIFNRVQSTEGSRYTVNVAGGGFVNDRKYVKRLGASYRQIIDLGKREEVLVIIDTGQSGNVWSNHYDDLMSLHAENQYIKLNLQLQDTNSSDDK